MKHVKNIYKQLSALVWKEDAWYVAKCIEIEVASQGETKNQAIENLKEALELYFQNEPNIIVPQISHLSLEKVAISHA